MAKWQVVKAVSHFVNIAERDAGFAKTKLNGVNREIRGVLFAVEAFLFGSSDDLPIDNQCSGRVVTLRDAIFALFQTRPMFPFEGNRPFKATKSKEIHPASVCEKL